jgi:1-acyl-sn-glycerol-3-phosphate acyltransferase
MNFEKFKPQEPSQVFLTRRQKIADKFWGWLENKNGEPILDEESLKNLRQANELLKTASLVIYVNHQKIVDAPIAIGLAMEHLPNAQNFLGPAGMKHFDLTRNPVNGLLLRALKLLHVYTIPVVQHKKGEKERYGESQASEMAAALRELAQDILGQAGMVYGIAPEGTRKTKGVPDDELVQARYGFGALRELHEASRVGYLPVAIIYPEKNSGQMLHIKVGPYVFWDEVIDPETLPVGDSDAIVKERNKMVADALMQRLAKLLPERMRGVYA